MKSEASPESGLIEQKSGEGKDLKFKLPSNADLKNLVQIGTSYKNAANAEEKQEVGNKNIRFYLNKIIFLRKTQ